ncbi:MAG: flagellar protein FlgN [Desulfocapsa sp.]|nr:flagellar protein FlgN [Desulfocapsa sp.]
MAASTTHENLVRLRDVILEERECTKLLDMETLTTVMQEKDELIQVLAHVQKLDEADQELATIIRDENRRNAYLFKATLCWIRETMEFFGKKTVASSYASDAAIVNSKINGRLLSGQV